MLKVKITLREVRKPSFIFRERITRQQGNSNHAYVDVILILTTVKLVAEQILPSTPNPQIPIRTDLQIPI